jgi:hypothetical protein
MKLSEISKFIDSFIKFLGDKEIKVIRLGTDNTSCELYNPERFFAIKEGEKVTILISDK